MGSQARPEVGGTFAGRYRIVRLLASGGMASVYVAVHLATEMKVALKLLHSHVLELDSARESFAFEAKVAARVLSPHVVQVLDAGIDESSGIPFLTMELLEGATVARHVERRGALPKQTVLDWLRQTAEALDAAHEHRDEAGVPQPIVHRDLKPENLFVHEPRGSEPRLKVLDFGIAKIASHSAVTSQQIRGTPLFISFEQLTAGRVTPATDVWALGLIAFYLLTGRYYWLSASRDAQTQALYAEIVTLPLEAPSARLPKLGLDASVTPEFDAWFLRAVNRDPAARFPTAGAAVRELVACLKGWEVAPMASAPATVLPESTLSSPGAAVAPGPPAPAPAPARPASAPATLVSAAPQDELSSSSPNAESFPAVESEPRTTRRLGARVLATIATVAALAAAAFFGLRESPSVEPSGESPERAAADSPELAEPPRVEPLAPTEPETAPSHVDADVRPGASPRPSPEPATRDAAPVESTGTAVETPVVHGTETRPPRSVRELEPVRSRSATANPATAATTRQPKPQGTGQGVDAFDLY